MYEMEFHVTVNVYGPNADHCLLILEVSRSHATTRYSR